MLTKRTREGGNEEYDDNLNGKGGVKRTRLDVVKAHRAEDFDSSVSLDGPRLLIYHLAKDPKALSHNLRTQNSESGPEKYEIRNSTGCKLLGDTPILQGEQNKGDANSSKETCRIAGPGTVNHDSLLESRSRNRFDRRNTLRGSITRATGLAKNKRSRDARKRWMEDRLRENTVTELSEWMNRL